MSQKLDRFYKYLERYERLVKSNAGRIVDRELAEDVSQETFVKMYEHMDYLVDERIKGWLLVVSENIAKDYVKKGGGAKTIYFAPNELSKQMTESYESAEDNYEKKERQKAARELLRTACSLLYEKNPNWYYIMVDSCMLGMSSAEIGMILNTTAGNVDVMKTRARSYLKKHLKNQYQDFF